MRFDPRGALDAPQYPLVVERITGSIRDAGRTYSRDELVAAIAAIAECVTPGERVAVGGAPSFGLVASVLGVMRGGGCVVPLSSWSTADQREALKARVGASKTLWDAEPGVATGAPLPVIKHADPAYIYFTSGTSGAQKGVVGTHGGLAHFIAWQGETFGAVAGDTCAQLTQIGFDVFLRDILFPLTTGKVLAIPPRDLGIAQLVRWLDQQQVTAIHTVPSLARAWLAEAPDDVSLAALRCVFIAGEPLQGSLVTRWRRRFRADTEVVNLYGPTETTLAKCFYRVPAAPGAEIQPIGQPLPHTQVLVLDERGALCEPGVAGELVIRTPYRTRGYLDPGPSEAEKFRPNPFRDDPDDIVYFTGDRGAYREDGTLEISGRVDDQLKIRGQRVDPAGLAALLASHARVAAAAVIARDEVLVAYVVAEASAAELRRFMAKNVPSYMVPAAFVHLEALPRTPNGKLDRNALPPPAVLDRKPYRAPTTDSERVLAQLWQELLGIEQVGIDDDFFALGGHSLTVMRMLSRLGELAMRDVFDAPTIAELAPKLAGRREPTIERQTELPLSFAQQRLWLLDQLTAGAIYNLPHVFRLTGAIDEDRLQRAFAAVHARHAGLRTLFATRDGEPVAVMSTTPFVIRRGDDVAAEVARPFDLTRELPWRVMLCGDQLAITMHHIVSDGWSADLLVDELAAAYAGRPLGELAIQYADFAAWQRERPMTEHLAYWKAQLANTTPVIELPHDHPRPPMLSYRGGRHAVQIEAVLTHRLEDLARERGVTMYMLMVAAFHTLLHRYARQDDIVVGSPLAGRQRRELEPVIGFFVNTVVLRGDFASDPTFADVLANMRRTVLDAQAHQDLPFDQLVDALSPARSTSYTPVFQTFFEFEQPFAREIALGDARAVAQQLDVPIAMFDLSMLVEHRPDALAIEVDYARDLFEPDTIGKVTASYVRLLEAIVANPEQRVSAIELGRAEQQATWDRDPPGVTARITAAMQTDATALIADDGAMSYAELDAATARFATALRAAGVGPERFVAIVADRGIPQMIGILAVLRAGGAFVAIATELPGERVAFMLDDVRPIAILCDGPPPAVVADFGAPILRLDHDLADGDPAWTHVPPEALAYVTYTSGSTGRPKGVMISRRSLDVQLEWAMAAIAMTPRDRVIQVSSAMFDASLYESLLPLMAGAAVVLPGPGGEVDPIYLTRLANKHAVTILNCVPTLIRMLVDAFAGTTWRAARLVMSGGEALPADLASRVRTVFPKAELHNMYGPSEITVDATRWIYEGGAIAIGAPIADTTTHIDAPPAGIGELWIGGLGVARGYMNRPGLTAERFVPAANGERVYRSGDLVRERAGAIEFLGRADQQVKISGFRIELAEIEVALRAIANDAVVVALDGKLVAYVVADDFEISAAREHLLASLPPYMVPAAFVVLDELPKLATGKIDRSALPAPSDESYERSKYVAPETETERTLAGLWQELLGVARVGLADNFFTLGGHSLLVMRMLARIRDAFGKKLAMRDVFETPELRGLAARLQNFAAASTITVEPMGLSEGPADLLQPYFWTLDHHCPEFRRADVWRLTGPLDPEAFARAVSSLGRHSLLCSTYEQRGELRQRVGDASPICERVGPEDILETANEMARAGVDLERGPVVKLRLARIADDDHILFGLVHHIVSDAPSTALLFHELDAAYRGEPLPPLPFQFLDVAAFLARYRDTAEGQADLAYWQRLADVAPIELPTDYPRTDVDAAKASIDRAAGKTMIAHFPASCATATADHGELVTAATRGTPMLAFLFAGLAALFHRERAQSEIVLQTALNIRPLLGAESLIGGFNSPIYVRCGRPATLAELVAQLRDSYSHAYAHALLSPMQGPVPAHAARVNLGFAGAAPPLRIGEATVTRMAMPIPPVTPFDLRPNVSIEGSRIAVSIDYNAQLFHHATVERLCTRYLAILRELAESPENSL